MCLLPDWTGGKIGNDDCADDVNKIDQRTTHYISGPIGVEGTEPGDCLLVEILDGKNLLPEPKIINLIDRIRLVDYFENMPWGYTGIFDRKEGGLFGEFSFHLLVKWICDSD
ncbi:hypothetical protein C0992_010444 [Termitomyces sp. T32_za158]|nr:hypothetical protein C0992_010444 [Termitomyces sp. T32_za158]